MFSLLRSGLLDADLNSNTSFSVLDIIFYGRGHNVQSCLIPGEDPTACRALCSHSSLWRLQKPSNPP